MKKPIINLDEVVVEPRPTQFAPTGTAAEKYEAKVGFIGTLVGAQKLGYNITEVPPGKRAYPAHSHRVNEEMFLILKGSGEVRMGDQTYAVKPGDLIACPPGGKETAHQIVNTGKENLRYLAVSTREYPEICDYPDSEKFGVMLETFRFIGRPEKSIDYWEGE